MTENLHTPASATTHVFTELATSIGMDLATFWEHIEINFKECPISELGEYLIGLLEHLSAQHPNEEYQKLRQAAIVIQTQEGRLLALKEAGAEDVEMVRAQIQELSDKLIYTEEGLSRAVKERDELIAMYNAMVKLRNESDEACKVLGTSLENVIKEREDLRLRLNDSTEHSLKLGKSLEQVIVARDDVTRRLEHTHAMLKDKERETSALRSVNKSQAGENTALRQEIGASREQVESLEKRILGLQEDVTEARKLYSNAQSELGTLRASPETKERRIDELHKIIKERDTSIESLRQDLFHRHQEISRLQVELSVLKSDPTDQVAHLKEVIKERENTIKTLHTNADAMERQLMDQEEALRGLIHAEGRLHNLKQAYQEQEERNAKLQYILNSLPTTVLVDLICQLSNQSSMSRPGCAAGDGPANPTERG